MLKSIVWLNVDGDEIADKEIKIFPFQGVNFASYEIEISRKELGIDLAADSLGFYTIVDGISSDITFNLLRENVNLGDVLVAVNNRIVVHDDYEDIMSYIEMLRDGKFSRRLRFLNTRKCSVSNFVEKMALHHKSHKDHYGFLRTIEYLEEERAR